MTAADRVIDFLVCSGVRTFFGVPGGPVMPVFDAVLRHDGARLIESRHETAAAFAAIGFWNITGQVPCVLVTAGPGGTNAVTGVAAAHCEQVPLVVLCGDVAQAGWGERMLQDMGGQGLQVERIYQPVTRAQVRLTHPSCASACALEVLEAATGAEVPGPALLVAPLDVAAAEAPAGVLLRKQRGRLPRDGGLVDIARMTAEVLAAAERPLIVVGAGAGASAWLVRQAAETLNIPFTTTPRAKGLIDERHPLSLRGCGMAASWWARRYTAKGVDAALVLGTDLDDCSIGPTPLVGPGAG
ncbi:thiamine pyrophosphate-binding protein [Streptomyces albireticuli]|uniref:thiamine pyrophosphate-binding protein n=1 Tax=Streptomyces albireticuli TaxID=1940 RepID=UPI0014751235|nr:thiamine pyrophosphate-binding protein [Streptomyces albireticuli]